MFYVGFISAERVDSEGWSHALGELLLGDATERFESDLRFWGIAQYEAQWRTAVARLVEASGSVLVTSYRGPEASYHFTWSLWREGQTVFFQERLLLTEGLSQPFDPNAAHEHMQPRETVIEDGDRLSEWRLPLGDVLTFVLE